MPKKLYNIFILVGITVIIALMIVLMMRDDQDPSESGVIPEQISVQEEENETVTNEALSKEIPDVKVEKTNNVGKQVDWSNPAWQVISAYYGQLPYDLEKAYAMRLDQSISFETYKTWYDHVEFAWVRNPVDIGDQTYQFFVNLAEEDPFNLSLYQVVMQVVDEKIIGASPYFSKVKEFGLIFC